MNYYTQGDPANADKIRAAFEKLGYDTSRHFFNAESVLYFTLNGEIRATTCNCTPTIIKTHPDYKELELPAEPKFKAGDKAPEWDGHTDKNVTRVMTLKPCYASQWISVDKELPPKRKDPIVISDKVFIHTTGGYYLSAVYDYQDKEWIDEYNIETLKPNEVTHWMKIVPPKKEE